MIMKNNKLIILLVLFLGLFLMRQIVAHSKRPQAELISLLTSQGYKNIQITDEGFGSCPKILEIPVRFTANLQEKSIAGIACFSLLSSIAPRIQFQN
jgi:hypothetical protein